MKRHLAFLTSVLLLFVLFAVVSCSEAANLKKDIIGKWIEMKGYKQIEFLKDGTVVWGSHAGDYKFIGDNRLRLDFKTEVTVFEVSIDKEGALILKEPTGGSSRYLTEKAYKEYKAKLDAQMKAEEERRRKADEEKRKVEEERKRKTEEARRKVAEKRLKEFIFSDLTVLDNKTKLMWARDANIAGEQKNWEGAFKFIKSLNEQKYAGYSDWRLPSKEELLTLVNFTNEQGYTKNLDEFLNKIGFKNVRGLVYWSSTTYASNTDDAWKVSMDRGVVDNYGKWFDGSVWPVRGGQ